MADAPADNRAAPADNPAEPADNPAEPAVEPVLEAANCNQDLPAWGVTRAFRFGQFVRLYDERIVDGRRVITPIVLAPHGDITETPADEPAADGGDGGDAGRRRAPGRRGGASADRPLGVPSPGTLSTSPTGRVAEVDLLAATSGADLDALVARRPEETIPVVDVDGLLSSGVVDVAGRRLEFNLGPDSTRRLREGASVVTIARDLDAGRSTVLELAPRLRSVELDRNSLDDILAARYVETDGVTVSLDEPAIRGLLTTGEFTGPAVRDGGERDGLIRACLTVPEGGPGVPAANAWVIHDLADFLTYPVLPSTTGGSVVVPLDGGTVGRLRRGEEVGLSVGGIEVRLICPPDGGPRPPGFEPLPSGLPPLDVVYDLREIRRMLYPHLLDGLEGGGGSAPATAEPESTGTGPKLSAAGLPVAVLLPWEQTWTLRGFSRGNLIQTLALAPGEETTLRVSSWERRAKALSQTTETETEQLFDYTSTTRDTEDVFREMTSANEFSAQASASFDASYSPGVASIRIALDGSVSNTNSLETTARSSTQHVRETTTRASTRVRSRRITTITETVESESRTEVTRHITNPNQCHTLTLNFHEVLAHYDIDIRFHKDQVRIVVLIANPVTIQSFDELTVRTNESVLRMNLLDPSLAEGFEACRLLESYRRAEDELRRLSAMAKAERELERERTMPKDTDPKKPENPHKASLLAVFNELKARIPPTSVDVGPALNSIAAHNPPTQDQVSNAQRWLWRRLVGAKLGNGPLGALDRAAGTAASPEAARTLLASVPRNAASPLDSLASLGDQDKEDAGLAARVKSMPYYDPGDWGWWYSENKKYGLYDADDSGIPGLLDKLRTTFESWEAKEAEGDGVQAAAAVVEQAKQEQAVATLADRLEMKFGAEMVGAAFERSQALRVHLDQHKDYYRFVLFQGLPPSEQLQRLMEAAPQLRVGMFEPRVVASDGPNLAVPLTPLASTLLMDVVENLADVLDDAATDAKAAGGQIATDHVILPTPGVSVESWLGDCSACEDVVEGMREAEVALAQARARSAKADADRRSRRVEAGDYDDPDTSTPATLAVTVTNSDGT